jgi:hypothetical protein
MEIIVKIEGQEMSFKSTQSSSIKKGEVKQITIHPSFSSEWNELEKYCVLFLREKGQITLKVENEKVIIKEELLSSPGIAFYFYGKRPGDTFLTYLLPTNFLKIFIGGN